MSGKAPGKETSALVPRGAGSRAASNAPTGTAGVRRPARAGRPGKMQQNVMNFYTDDSPGLKISPVVVIGMSLGFILFVTILHFVGKLRGV